MDNPEDIEMQYERTGAPPEWDSELLGYGLVSPMQSSAFIDLMKLRGFEPAYFYLRAGGETIGQVCVGLDRHGFAVWYYGPVVKAGRPLCYNAAFRLLIEELRNEGAACIENATTCARYHGGALGEPEKYFHIYNEIIDTPYIDLGRSSDELFASFDRAVRKNIRKCDREGAKVEFGKSPGLLETYLEMLKYHRAELGFDMPPFYPDGTSVELFDRPGTEMLVAVASVDDTPLAGLGYVRFGGLLIEIAVAQSPEFRDFGLPLHDLIKVRAMDYFRDRGAVVYDLMGAKKEPATEKESNIRRFKMKFTDRTADIGIVERKVLSKVKFIGAKVGKKISSMLDGHR